MRSIIQDGSDDMPPTVFEGAIHILKRGLEVIKRGTILRIIAITCMSLELLLSGCTSETGTSTLSENNSVSDNASDTASDNTSNNTPVFIKEETIDVGNLNKEFDIFFIADSHISLCDDRDAELKHKAVHRSFMYKRDGINAWDRFDALISEANKGNDDIVILGGDIIDSAMYASIDHVQEQINKLNKPYVYSMGNHDFEYGDEYFSKTAYEQYLPRLSSMRDGTQYQIREYEDLIIFTADDKNNQIDASVLEAYKEVTALNKPVVLVTHVPLEPEDGSGLLLKRCREVYGDSYDKTSGLFIGENGCKPNRTTREFLHLILADDSPVVLVISGHIHFYHKENLNENTVEIVSGPAFAGEALRIRLL